MKILLGLAVLAGMALWGSGLSAQESVEAVTRKDGKMLIVREGQTAPMTNEVILPYDIKVRTNATFTVKQRKPRELKEGQVLARDGMLTSPGGTVEPVFDHIAIKKGTVLVFTDGQNSPLGREMVLKDGSKLLPDGTRRKPGGIIERVIDGQLFMPDGSVVAPRDTITLRDGKVFVQKDGTQFSIGPDQSITMNDGTKVFGSGLVVKLDGSEITLVEGQIVAVEGVVKLR